MNKLEKSKTSTADTKAAKITTGTIASLEYCVITPVVLIVLITSS